jgi:hypothetical protein
MDNIKPLNNFPTELLDKFKEVYRTMMNELDTNKIAWDKWSVRHWGIDATRYIPDEIKLEFQVLKGITTDSSTWHLYSIGKGTMTPHKDRARRCCIQIPVNRVENAFTFSVKNDGLPLLNSYGWNDKIWGKRVAKTKWINKDADTHWTYEEQHFDLYDTASPYIQNSSQPHGGKNDTGQDRHLFSISIVNHSYDEVVELFKHWH